VVKAQINPAGGKEPADTRAPPERERSLPLARAQVARVTPAITALFPPPPAPVCRYVLARKFADYSCGGCDASRWMVNSLNKHVSRSAARKFSLLDFFRFGPALDRSVALSAMGIAPISLNVSQCSAVAEIYFITEIP